MNRGSVSHSHVAVVDTVRFNEAPIHESGKCRTNRAAMTANRVLQ